jgi:hypothetical protein
MPGTACWSDALLGVKHNFSHILEQVARLEVSHAQRLHRLQETLADATLFEIEKPSQEVLS